MVQKMFASLQFMLLAVFHGLNRQQEDAAHNHIIADLITFAMAFQLAGQPRLYIIAVGQCHVLDIKKKKRILLLEEENLRCHGAYKSVLPE